MISTIPGEPLCLHQEREAASEAFQSRCQANVDAAAGKFRFACIRNIDALVGVIDLVRRGNFSGPTIEAAQDVWNKIVRECE